MNSLSRLGRPTGSLLRCLERQSHGRFIATRTFHSSPIRSEEKGKDTSQDNLSFRGQLYQSTAERLKRERASEEKYIKAQAGRGEGSGSRSLTLSFSMCFSVWRTWSANSQSHSRGRRRRLLPWGKRRKATRGLLDHSSFASTSSSARHTNVESTSGLGRLCPDCWKGQCLDDTR